MRFICLRRCLFVAVLAFGLTAARAQNDPETRRAAIDAMYPVMMQAMAAKKYGSARNICDQAILWEPQNPVHHYNLACIEAQTGERRFSHALAALEQAVALGFNDVQHLQSDTDLAPLRGDPKFAAIVRTLTSSGANAAAATPLTVAAPIDAPAEKKAAPAPAPKAANAAPRSATTSAAALTPPAGADFKAGAPVGLYFMTRFWTSNGSLEKVVWYFAPDGSVYQNLQHGFSADDLAAHRGPKGTAKIAGDKLEVSWATGKKTSSRLSRDGSGFGWDAGIFTPVTAFGTATEAAGVFEGGESLTGAAGRAAVAKRLELRPDGTFTWNGVSFVSSNSGASELSAGSTGGSKGSWELNGFSLTLTADTGVVFRGIAFPYDDAKTPVKPDRMFFGGLMYKKQ